MPIRETRAEELLALGVFGRGSRLSDRIEMPLGNRREFSPRVSRLRVAMSAAVLAGCVVAAALAPRVVALAETKPSFETAAVRAVSPDAHGEPRLEISGGNLTMERQSVKNLMEWAYGVEGWRISGPSWVDSQDFDVRAKAAGPVPQDQLKLMLQSLLEDRFKLKLHREQKIVPVYSLVVGKDGPKLHEVQDQPHHGGRLGWTDGVFTYQLIDHVSALTGLLPSFLDDSPVLDRTGLSGVYEITLRVQMEPDQIKRMPQPGVFWAGFGYTSGVFDAVEQLGLKLEATKGPVEILVIDHVEKPDAN